jgi:outer membrane immunogenic protein
MKSWNVSCHLVTPAPQITDAPKAEVAARIPVARELPKAASTPSSQARAEKVSQHDWAGFYAGAILGYQFGHSTNTTGDFGYNADDDQWSYSESGLNVGAEFGYNSTSGRLVAGPEIELGYMNTSGSGAQPDAPGSDTVGQTSSDFYAALRARVGVDFNSYLLFATAGGIGINYETQVNDNCSIAPCGGSTVSADKKTFQFGYTFGAGVEHLFEVAEKSWSVKLEYLYFNLGSQSFSGTTNLGVQYSWTGQTSGNIVRAGLNFHF